MIPKLWSPLPTLFCFTCDYIIFFLVSHKIRFIVIYISVLKLADEPILEDIIKQNSMYLWKSENVQESNNHACWQQYHKRLIMLKNYLSSNIVDDICAAGKYLKIKIIFFYKKTLLLLKFFLSI